MLKWLDNFWYHHKWAVIITTFFLVVVIVCSVQMANKQSYDSCFMFIGNGGNITGTQYQDIRSSLKSVSSDVDKDKEISVLFSREAFIADSDDPVASNINSNITTFMQTTLYQDYYIYFIDPVLYEYYKDSGVFVPLADYIDNIPQSIMYDERAIKLSHCEFYSYAGISAMPEDTLIVLKTVPYFSSAKKTEYCKSLQSTHAEIIAKIIEKGILENGTNE